MWRLLFALCFLGFVHAEPASAQQWNGTAAVGLSGGSQTNLYLDPVLGTWNPEIDPAFAAVTPRVGLSRIARRSRLDLTVQSRFYPSRTAMPQHTQGLIRTRYEMTPHWSVGVVGGGTRYRFPLPQGQEGETARDSWWALPSLRWTPSADTDVTARVGLTRRYERSSDPTDRQTSGIGMVQIGYWMTDRLRGEVRAYVTEGRTSVTETGIRGTGGSVRATYWPTPSVSVRGSAGLEQLEYDPSSATTALRDQIGRAGLEVNWEVQSSVTLFGRAEGLSADLGQNDTGTTDVHVSGGVRLQLQRDLGGSSAPPPRRRVCEDAEEGLRLRVPYEGDGTPHVTGDFNGWSLPGTPMEPGAGDMWETSLDLPPGRYTYRVRVVADDEEHWLDLPSYATTVEDSFGGTNGVCTIQ